HTSNARWRDTCTRASTRPLIDISGRASSTHPTTDEQRSKACRQGTHRGDFSQSESERQLMPTQQPFRVVAQGIDTLVVNARGKLFWEIRHQLDDLQAQALAERNTTRGRRRAQTLVETPGAWLVSRCSSGRTEAATPNGAGS